MAAEVVEEDVEAEEVEQDQYLVFTTQSQEFGIQALWVQEITSVLPVTQVPNAPVYIDGKWGVIDKTGRIVIEPKFDDTRRQFMEGLLAVEIEKKWGFIDTIGKFIIDPMYDDAWSFSNGYAAVAVGDNWGYIDKKGNDKFGMLK